MFYDLNVPWAFNDPELPRTIAFLDELGYNVLVLNHTLAGKLPADLTSPIPITLPFLTPPHLHLLRRCTLVLSNPSQNHRLSSLAAAYDILAIRPVDEKTLQQACTALDCDLISLDLTQRLPFHFKFKTLSAALGRGIKFEICYAPAITASDATARRNLISNATQLIRATRGRGLVISSEARRAAGCRGPWDVVNLAAVWGLGQERGWEAVAREARSVVISAGIKRTGFRGVIDVVYGGERTAVAEKTGPGNKRKAEVAEGTVGGNEQPKQLSNREKKRRAAAERHGAEARNSNPEGGKSGEASEQQSDAPSAAAEAG